MILFGVRGKNARTLGLGRRQVNVIKTQKREHSRKPDEIYDIIEACSSGPYLELFARGSGRAGLLGAIRRTSTSLLGPPTQITRRAAGIRIIRCFSTCPAPSGPAKAYPPHHTSESSVQAPLGRGWPSATQTWK
ncbi:MAG: MT-A70 family methyltransferase [Terriglobales bacterium]